MGDKTYSAVDSEAVESSDAALPSADTAGAAATAGAYDAEEEPNPPTRTRPPAAVVAAAVANRSRYPVASLFFLCPVQGFV